MSFLYPIISSISLKCAITIYILYIFSSRKGHSWCWKYRQWSWASFETIYKDSALKNPGISKSVRMRPQKLNIVIYSCQENPHSRQIEHIETMCLQKCLSSHFLGWISLLLATGLPRFRMVLRMSYTIS